MPCVLVSIALLLPRFLMLFIWLLSGWFGRAFEGFFVPFLGFFVMPYTTLAYMAGMLNNNGSIHGWWAGLLIAAVFVDLGNWGGGHRVYVWSSRH